MKFIATIMKAFSLNMMQGNAHSEVLSLGEIQTISPVKLYGYSNVHHGGINLAFLWFYSPPRACSAGPSWTHQRVIKN